MRYVVRMTALAISITGFVSCSSHSMSSVAPAPGSLGFANQADQSQSIAPWRHNPMHDGAAEVCAGPAPAGEARCLALIRVDLPMITTDVVPDAISGYHPSDIANAYKLPTSTGGTGQTVAIVDAHDDPKAEADLAKYRAAFGLGVCSTANGCFKKVNESGVAGSYPSPDVTWAAEISLDLDMASATCHKCHILLVEARTASFLDLGKSVDTAVTLGANTVSNSYGGPEFSSESTLLTHYQHPGHAIVASAGDSGFGTQIPAAFAAVTSVGGTHLVHASNARGWAESVWSGTGSGCTLFITKPSWQHDTGCSHRTMNDVAAVADPATGVAVYDTYMTGGTWFVFGGTSVSSPIVGAVYALAGNASTVVFSSFPYSHTSSLFDVKTGSNGSCSPAYLCNGETGFDGPTGWGTPDGTGAF